MKKRVSACMTGVAVLCLLLTGFFKEYPIEVFVGDERTVILDVATNPVTPRA